MTLTLVTESHFFTTVPKGRKWFNEVHLTQAQLCICKQTEKQTKIHPNFNSCFLNTLYYLPGFKSLYHIMQGAYFKANCCKRTQQLS